MKPIVELSFMPAMLASGGSWRSHGPDDGTLLAPWAVVPFAPELVLPTIENYERIDLREAQKYGYKAAFISPFQLSRTLNSIGYRRITSV